MTGVQLHLLQRGRQMDERRHPMRLTNTPSNTELILDFEAILKCRSGSISLFSAFDICHKQC